MIQNGLQHSLKEEFMSFVFFDKGQGGASEGIDGAEQLKCCLLGEVNGEIWS